MHHDEGIGGEDDCGLKDLPRVSETLIDTAYANISDLDLTAAWHSEERHVAIPDRGSASRSIGWRASFDRASMP